MTANPTLVAAGSVWNYLDNGSDQKTSGRFTGFNDGTWKLDSAELGYGGGDERTVVGYGMDATNKFTTTLASARTSTLPMSALSLRSY